MSIAALMLAVFADQSTLRRSRLARFVLDLGQSSGRGRGASTHMDLMRRRFSTPPVVGRRIIFETLFVLFLTAFGMEPRRRSRHRRDHHTHL
jgi:hypothetical protein